MTITIELDDPRHPGPKALLEASHALMESLFPPESNHYLSIDALCIPSITFLVAKEDGKTLGCGALANKGDYGEIKSMFVDPAARGKGIANQLMQALETTARDQGLPMMRLETGHLLKAAHKLYAKHGFTYCSPFGEYTEDPNSIFMEKAL